MFLSLSCLGILVVDLAGGDMRKEQLNLVPIVGRDGISESVSGTR